MRHTPCIYYYYGVVLLLLLVSVLLSKVDCFSSSNSLNNNNDKRATTGRTWTSVSASTTNSNPNSNSRDREEPPNLYEILGASPKDSDAVLKRKWQLLAKKLHPDANVIQRQQLRLEEGEGSVYNNIEQQQHQQQQQYPYELSDVNAAWGILSNPKERRKYDRALQAQELTDTFEILMDAGIQSAIPFFKKTADSTMAAAKTTSKIYQQSAQAMDEMNKKMTLRAALSKLEAEAREMDRKARKAQSKIQQLQNQLQNPPQQNIPALQSAQAPLSATEAKRLLKRFTSNLPSPNTEEVPAAEIQVLSQLETEFTTTRREYQMAESDLIKAQKLVQEALQAEQLAQEKLRLAQEQLATAQAYQYQTQAAQEQALQQQQQVASKGQEQEWQLQQQTERVKYALQQTQQESIQQLQLQLQSDIQSLESAAEEWQQEAQRIQQQARQFKRENKL